MLRLEHRKALISEYLIALIASVSGYKIAKDNLDTGIDMSIIMLKTYNSNGKIRYMNSGKTIDIQIKCTTQKQISLAPNALKYDLDVKNYNDLIKRGTEDEVIPLILIVVILPEKIEDWVLFEKNHFTLNVNQFWFHPNQNAIFSKNKQQIRIEIPLINRINKDFFNILFEKFHSK